MDFSNGPLGCAVPFRARACIRSSRPASQPDKRLPFPDLIHQCLFSRTSISTVQFGQLLLFWDWPFNKHGCCFFLMCDWCCPLTQAIRKGVCLNHCYADGASTRIGSRRLRNFGAYKDFVKEWRSGFNRYRRTWAGPKADNRNWRLFGAGQRQQRETFLSILFPFLVTHVPDRWGGGRIRVPLSIYN